MSPSSQVRPGERDPSMPPGLPVIAVAAIVLVTLMYVLFPGHGPIQGHVNAPVPAASDKPG
jgi:hypothetical protein